MRPTGIKDIAPLHAGFAETKYGKKLAGEIRWGRYKSDTVSNERWEELLGADVNNLNHLSLSLGLTKVFVQRTNEAQPGLLSQDDIEVLLTGSVVHDWAESIVGDIMYDKKTQNHADEEYIQFIEHLDDFYTGNSVVMRGQIVTAAEEVVFDITTRLGRMFNAIEAVGYVRTAIRANQHIVDGTAPDCEEGLRWLVADALSHHISRLTEYSDDMPPIKEYLLNQSEKISTAYAMIDVSTFQNYGEDADMKMRMVGENYEAWQGWLKSISQHDGGVDGIYK